MTIDQYILWTQFVPIFVQKPDKNKRVEIEKGAEKNLEQKALFYSCIDHVGLLESHLQRPLQITALNFAFACQN
jgi:hypothetical protein